VIQKACIRIIKSEDAELLIIRAEVSRLIVALTEAN